MARKKPTGAAAETLAAPSAQPAKSRKSRKPTGRTPKGQFAKGVSGNPAGRKPGTLNEAHQLIRERLQGRADDIVQALISRALKGSTDALESCMARLSPAPKHQPREPFDIGDLSTPASIIEARIRITRALAFGEIDIDLANALDQRVEALSKARDIGEVLDQFHAARKVRDKRAAGGGHG